MEIKAQSAQNEVIVKKQYFKCNNYFIRHGSDRVSIASCVVKCSCAKYGGGVVPRHIFVLTWRKDANPPGEKVTNVSSRPFDFSYSDEHAHS